MHTPIADPVPWITKRLSAAGAFATIDERVWDYPTAQYVDTTRITDDAARATLDVLASLVAGLHNDSKSYRVVLSAGHATAGTRLIEKIVEVGSKPMNDDTLTIGQKAAVMAGLVLHEVGHIRHARDYREALIAFYGADKITGAISTLSNVVADHHDETAAMRTFPGLAKAIAVTLWWVGGRANPTLASDRIRKSAADRVNLAIAASRYPWKTVWDTPEAQAWLDWWTDWAERCKVDGSPDAHVARVDEAITKIRDITYAPEPPVIDEPPVAPPPDGPGGDDEPPDGPGGDEGPDEPPADEPPTTDGGDETNPGGSNADDEPPTGEGKTPGDPTDEGGDDAPTTDEPPTDAGEGNPGGEPTDEPPTDAPTGAQAGTDGKETPYDADEDAKTDEPCAGKAARDPMADGRLQEAANRAEKGRQEGRNTRLYNHAGTRASTVGGRTVKRMHRGQYGNWEA